MRVWNSGSEVRAIPARDGECLFRFPGAVPVPRGVC